MSHRDSGSRRRDRDPSAKRFDSRRVINLVQLLSGIIRGLRHRGQRPQGVGRHTARPQQQSEGKQEQTRIGLIVQAASAHPVCTEVNRPFPGIGLGEGYCIRVICW